MRKYLILLMAALPAISANKALGRTHMVEIDNMFFELDKSDHTAMLTVADYDDYFSPYYSGDVSIPPYVDYDGETYTVTSIDKWTFSWALTDSLHLPATVVDVDEEAFMSMVSLSKVTVDENNPAFTVVDNVLFSRDMKVLYLFPVCRDHEWGEENTKCVEYVIPEGVEEIYTGFSSSGLKSIILPSTLKKVGPFGLFCADLTKIELPEGLEYLGRAALASLHIKSDLHIPESVTHIGKACFTGSSFTSINIPENIAYIGQDWFNCCHNLQTIEMHDGITKICSGAFKDSGIQSISLPKGVVEIESGAFNGSAIQTITLPDGITEIPDRVFDYSDIQEVHLGMGIERIGQAFNSCEKFTDIYCPMDNPPKVNAANPLGLDEPMLLNVNVHVRQGYGDIYRKSWWKRVGPIIEDLTDGMYEISDDKAIFDNELCDVYTISGSLAAKGYPFSDLRNTLPKGIYVVLTKSGKSAKLIIK